MSREQPVFGEVFRWTRENFEQLVMYVGPGTRDEANIWAGLTVQAIGEHALYGNGPVDRLPLSEPHWIEVPE